jgi:hypothetical protein
MATYVRRRDFICLIVASGPPAARSEGCDLNDTDRVHYRQTQSVENPTERGVYP